MHLGGPPHLHPHPPIGRRQPIRRTGGRRRNIIGTRGRRRDMLGTRGRMDTSRRASSQIRYHRGGMTHAHPHQSPTPNQQNGISAKAYKNHPINNIMSGTGPKPGMRRGGIAKRRMAAGGRTRRMAAGGRTMGNQGSDVMWNWRPGPKRRHKKRKKTREGERGR